MLVNGEWVTGFFACVFRISRSHCSEIANRYGHVCIGHATFRHLRFGLYLNRLRH